MQPYVRKLFSEEVRAECQRIWGIRAFEELLGEAENFVYKVDLGDRQGVFRLTHSDRRPQAHIDAEISFMRHMDEGGVPVPEIWSSLAGETTQRIEVERGYFTGVLMEEVRGTVLSKRYKSGEVIPEWIVQEWGRALGRMHRISAELNTRDIKLNRSSWDSVYEMEDASIPGDSPIRPFHEERQRKVGRLHEFEPTADSFGLIHTDLHQGNVIVAEDSFTCIDFDDASYHFFIQDIGMPLYYMFLRWKDGDEVNLYRFFATFLAAYQKEYKLGAAWFDHLPLFFEIRDLDLKVVLTLWEFPEDNPVMIELNRRMKEGNPMLGMPWRKWAEEVS